MRNFTLLLALIFLISCSRSPRFQLIDSKETGIGFENTIVETDSLNVANYEYIYNGAGVGVADLNRDGLPDLIFVGNEVSPRVYLNLGHFKFKDITANFKGIGDHQWFSGVAIVDINSDGWPDVYLTATGNWGPLACKNRLWVNNGVKGNGDPTFTEEAEKYGIADENESVSAAFFDYDGDGDLDLYVLNNTLNQRMNTRYREKINDGSAPNNDRLYRNNGDGTFTDVTLQAGIVNEGFGLGLAIGDVNKDGFPDIYVSDDFSSNDLLYINQGNGTFKNEIRKYMSYQTKSSMGDDMADVNNDGNLDMFTLDMMPSTYIKRKQTNNGFSYIYYLYDAKYDYEHQYVRNMLHLHNGFMNGQMLPYSEVGQFAGIFQTEWSWSPLFADYDNDGDKDLLISNGYPKDMTDKDWTKYKSQIAGYMTSEREALDMAPPAKVPNEAFENTGNLHFINRSKEWLPQIPSFSNGAAFVDLDGDGDLDYVVNNINDKPFILKNNTIERSRNNAHYIKLKLIGKAGNTMALGAKIELWDKGNYQYTEHFLTRGFASSIDPVVHFGLGKNTMIDSIRIIWPSTNYATVLKNIKVDQVLEINEKDARPVAFDFRPARNKELLFSSDDSLLNYMHQQNDIVDFFFNQKIIPHKFSQIGPAMAKGDLNHDGREDLIVGSTDVLPTTAFVRKGRGFIKADFAGLTTAKKCTEGDLAVADFNRDGWNDVVAVAGGYENPDEKDYKHYLYINHKGTFEKTELPIPAFPSTVVRVGDFDHDGYPDLFIGSRVMKGKYPLSDHSWLIINRKGHLMAPPATCSLDLGMVTDAVWTDYDKDGWEDLLVVREWDSPLLLKNMQGKALVPQHIPELEKYHGIWYSVVAGDFNRDGYDDYIFGNLGENNRFNISEQYPMNLYAIDLDMDGNLDPIMTGYWPDKDGKMQEYPVNYLDELSGQSKFFQTRFKDYKSFSVATIHDIIDADIMKRLDRKLTINTASSYVLWHEKGKLIWEKLPLPVQLAPVTRMIVRDVNDDQWPDVILGGNDYSYDVSTGYYDANKGIVLLNKKHTAYQDNNPSFDVLTPVQSGMLLQGMLGSLQYFDGDTLMVIAGFNRAKAHVFEHIRKKEMAKGR